MCVKAFLRLILFLTPSVVSQDSKFLTLDTIDLEIAYRNWPLYIATFCGRSCQNGSLVIQSNLCMNPRCFPCECNEWCSLKGTCCPTIDTETGMASYEEPSPHPDSYLYDIQTRFACISPRFGTMSNNPVLVVVKCPSNWTDTRVSDLCETRMDDAFYYIDQNTGIVFNNIYCGQCHGLNNSRLQPIPLIIKCNSHNGIYHTGGLSNLLDHVITKDYYSCFVTFQKDIMVTNCSLPSSYTGEPQLSCFDNINPKMIELCHKLPNVIGLKFGDYQNIFCYWCSSHIQVYRDDSCSGDEYRRFSNPFTFYRKIVYPDILIRKQDLLYIKPHSPSLMLPYANYRNACTLECSAGKYLTSDDKCRTGIESITGLWYRVDMIFKPTDMIQSKLFEDGFQFFNGITTLDDEDFFYSYTFDSRTCGHRLEQEIHLVLYLYATKFVTRDEFENKTLHILTKSLLTMSVTDDIQMTHNIKLYLICLGKELCDIYRSLTREKNCDFISYRKIDSSLLPTDKGSILNFIDFTSSLVCPFVILNVTSLPYVENEKIVITFILETREMTIYAGMDASVVNGLYRMCQNACEDIIKIAVENKEANSVFSKPFILTQPDYYFLLTICTSTSFVLLLIPTLTYILFPSLRSLPGINTLCLCVSLLTAQVSLLITSMAGVRGLLTPIHCLIHGIVLHYSWMSSFLWMNVSCIHMYQVFKGLKMVSVKKQVLKYCVYTFGSSGFIVVVVIIITVIITSGQTIGYNRNTCFLETKTSVLIFLIGMFVPLGVSIIVNVSMFTLSVKEFVSIRKTRQMRSFCCIVFIFTLSVVSGIFCFLTLAAFWNDDVTIACISCPFITLQGVLSLVIFLTDVRVFTLYMNALTYIHSHFKRQT